MPVCITGATGFIGAHITRSFLAAGINVRAAVRSPDKAAFLLELPGPGRLEVVVADLLRPETWIGAIAGCEGLIHTAAHVVLASKDPERDIITPAVEGTRAVLDAAARAGTVRRVVLTSSVAAVGGSRKAATRPLTEADWNLEATIERAPYEVAKTREEQLAVELTQQHQQWDLVTINPAMVLGPVLSPPHLKASPVVVRDILLGRRGWLPDITTGVVDVREVAAAHLAAWRHPSAYGRYILSKCSVSVKELSEMLARRYPERGIRYRHVPKLLAALGGAFTPGLSVPVMWELIGFNADFDGSRAVRELGVVYRELGETVADTADSVLPHLRQVK